MDLSDCVKQVGEHTLHYSKCDEHLFSGRVSVSFGTSGLIYVKTKGDRVHRKILGLFPNDGLEVDHINHNGLDNRRCNLRVCTRQQNQMNKRAMKGSSKFKGVFWHSHAKKWGACITLQGRNKYIGVFISEIDAARAYDRYAAEHFGEFAYLNFPQLQSAS